MSETNSIKVTLIFFIPFEDLPPIAGGGGVELCEWQAHFRRETSYSNARGSTRSHHILNMYLCSLSVRYITTLIRQKYVLLVNIRERYSIKISD